MNFRRASLITLILVGAFLGQARADDVVDGEFGPGALYRLVRPTSWNGNLVVYAHGAVSPDQPVAITPDDELVISLLTPQGFAVAVSSFSANGWVVRMGPSVLTSCWGSSRRNSDSPPWCTLPAHPWVV